MGRVGAERQIVNVADATEGTDAVNKRQMDSAIADLGDGLGDLDATAVRYDEKGKARITLGGEQGTTISNVRAGVASTDAVNVDQHNDVVRALGGGAALGGDGMLIGPVYTVQGVRFGNVGGAVGALDGAVSALGTRVGLLESAAAPAPGPGTGAGGSGESGGQLPIGTGPGEGADAGGPGHGLVVAGTGKGAVAIGEGSIANDADTVSVGSTDNLRRITHVGSGTAASDAATVGQMQAGDAQTLASARTYTDSRFKEMDDRFVDLSQGVDQRLHQQDRRIDRQGAMSSAMMNMALNAAGSRSPRGRVAVGAGWQNGEQALSVGYGKQVGERASFSLGGAFSGSDRSAGVGFGIDL